MISEQGRRLLLAVAADSIRHGLTQHRPLPVASGEFPDELRPYRATFVTLQRHGQLRGCLGMLEPMRPLVEDVAENAYAAAFRDPRFAPLTAAELEGLELHISVLSPPQPMRFTCERDLVAQLRPGVDGVIVRDGYCRGTFLPSVWESLPNPEDFFCHLKMKAGLPPDHWSDTLQAECYSTESFGGPLPPPHG